MRTALARIWIWLPAVLAFAILAVQVWIPFSAQNFETQDGSAYVYSAVVARDLILDLHSPYSSVYQFRHAVVPNWGGLILLNAILCVTGVEYAERVLMAVTLVIGFFSVSYLIRSFAPRSCAWTPLTNFVLQTLLLWTGFYNFYLSTMAAIVLIGYYVRRPGRMTFRVAVILSGGLICVFLIHLMGAAIAMLCLGVLAIWRWMVEPDVVDRRTGLRQIALVAGAMIPTLVLAAVFAVSSGKPADYVISPLKALSEFPLNMFSTAGGLLGEQTLLWPVVLAAAIFVIVRMRREEWKTIRGGLAMSAIASFAVYLIVPDGGFGGGQAKIRFAWALFIFSAALITATPRFAALRIGLPVYAATLLAFNLAATTRALKGYSSAISDYISAVGELPRGARMFAVRYEAPDLPLRYGFPGLYRDPLRHVDGLLAARCHCVDVTEFQPLSYIFPVIIRPSVDREHQDELWHDLEEPNHRTTDTLRWLMDSGLGPFDYVIIEADRLSPRKADSFPALIADLNEMGMELTIRSRRSPFVRVYANASNGAQPPD